MEDDSDDSNVDYGGGSSHEEGNNISSWYRNHSCGIFAKIAPAFYPCFRNLPEPKLKDSGLTFLVDEISRQPSIYSVTCLFVCLFVLAIILMRECDEEVRMVQKTCTI